MSYVIWIKRGFNACQTHCSMYPSIFNRLRAIARYWSEIATFSYPLHLTPALGCSHWNSGEKFGSQKTRIIGLPGSEKQFDDRLSRFDTIYTPACDGQTDGQTDRQTDVQPISKTCVKKSVSNSLNGQTLTMEKMRWRHWGSHRASLSYPLERRAT